MSDKNCNCKEPYDSEKHEGGYPYCPVHDKPLNVSIIGHGKPEQRPAGSNVWVNGTPESDGFYAVKYTGGGYGGCGFKDGKWNQSLTDNKIVAYLRESNEQPAGNQWINASVRMPIDKKRNYIFRQAMNTRSARVIYLDHFPDISKNMQLPIENIEWLDEQPVEQKENEALKDKSGLRETIEDIILSAGKHNQEQCTEIADAILRESGPSEEGNKERGGKDFADWIAQEGHYKNDGKWYTFYGVIIAESTEQLWNEWNNQQNRNNAG